MYPSKLEQNRTELGQRERNIVQNGLDPIKFYGGKKISVHSTVGGASILNPAHVT